jgi:hypothetical protein
VDDLECAAQSSAVSDEKLNRTPVMTHITGFDNKHMANHRFRQLNWIACGPSSGLKEILQ